MLIIVVVIFFLSAIADTWLSIAITDGTDAETSAIDFLGTIAKATFGVIIGLVGGKRL